MVLQSIHSGRSNARSNRQASMEPSATQLHALKQITKSDHKYSLADLDRIIMHDGEDGSEPNMKQHNKTRARRRKIQDEQRNDSDTAKRDTLYNVQNNSSEHIEVGSGSKQPNLFGKNEEGQEDVHRKDMDDEMEIESVSNYLSDQRTHPIENKYSRLRLNETDNISMDPKRLQTAFILDSNFIISHLQTLEGLKQLSEQYHHIIVIPRTVIKELDGLKTSNNAEISKLARAGNDWIYKNLANLHSGIIGQKLKQRINPAATKDDSILDCCLYFKEIIGCFTILLSNDKNLCLKALTEEVLTVSYRKGMTSELIAQRAYQENMLKFGDGSGTNIDNIGGSKGDQVLERTKENLLDNVHEEGAGIFEQIEKLAVAAVNKCMIESYGNDLALIGFDPNNLSSLHDCVTCICEYWISVFSGYLNNSSLNHMDQWKGLPDVLLRPPETLQDLDNLISFWKEALEYIFLCSEEFEHEQLQRLFHEWDQFI
ncbi:mRNA-processing endoribonuclease KNAG_0M01080 [Huiozyma naganishii CBS 8797]|uniref:Transcriptional protein SWT1 n=1 Tax=Huiozyma naganishii (strain ATCC MYA-139 / BCRC 22969 / CBS 8797 / KCTC 17520 / NBRC 10181 / NCYC 3082 / Yp74L-3) TaxID=1071383 RepID=J7SBD2_HUIN7|nr:hypothetical protein KNAG_0M01080 [Kazachstania naganishii CBS 8797]CCK72961.1 hypothetical protein KNAG_0M01080 [Kazachstania naganishii CBS 8797]